MKKNKEYTTAEITFIELCEEVDYWKSEAKKWKELYQNEVQERNKEWNERNEDAKKAVGNALMFALSVKDDANGNLIINKEDRKILSERYKS